MAGPVASRLFRAIAPIAVTGLAALSAVTASPGRADNHWLIDRGNAQHLTATQNWLATSDAMIAFGQRDGGEQPTS